MAILLKGLILPIGGDSAVEGLLSTGLPRLVLGGGGNYFINFFLKIGDRHDDQVFLGVVIYNKNENTSLKFQN